MKNLLSILSACYGRLLRLFPARFHDQFGEEMQLDFTDGLSEAAKKGPAAVFLFMLREARDLPWDTLRAHLEDGGMLRVLRSQPVNNGLRGALGFGIAYALAGLVSTWALQTMLAPESFITRLQVYYFDAFHTEHGLELISQIPSWLSSLVAGLLIGAVLAMLFGDRASYSRYIIAGMLGWFLHNAVIDMVWIPYNLDFYLGTRHSTWLAYALRILSGAFLGLIFVTAKSEKRQPLRWLAAGSLLYPLTAYLYVRLLFKLFIVETPWMFIALIALVTLYICSVFFIALQSGFSWRAPWMVLVGAAAIIISQVLAGYLIRSLFAPLMPHIDTVSVFSWSLQFQFAAMNAIYGLFFGLLLGMISGVQRRIRPAALVP